MFVDVKTNVTMISSDRKLLGTTIRQQTKNGWLNLSDLQDAYDKVRFENGWSKKSVQEILSYKENQFRIFYIIEKQGITSSSLNEFMEEVDNEGIAKVLKRYGVYKTIGARHTKTTWCNPYLWILVAMELNPMIYAEAVVWLTDSLIINRIEAGNLCRELNSALSRYIINPDYIKIAKALNIIVFSRHEFGIRNRATKNELQELAKIEEKVAYAIENKWLKTQDDILEHLRLIYKNKYALKK